MANYKVIIEQVNFGEIYSADFEGEGSTIDVALKRAEKEMFKEYTGGVHGCTYSSYKIKDYRPGPDGLEAVLEYIGTYSKR